MHTLLHPYCTLIAHAFISMGVYSLYLITHNAHNCKREGILGIKIGVYVNKVKSKKQRHILKNYEKYIRSAKWKKVRGYRMKYDEFECQSPLPMYQNCLESERLEVHHLTYDNLGRELLGDIVTLCQNCHDRVEDIIQNPFEYQHIFNREDFDSWKMLCFGDNGFSTEPEFRNKRVSKLIEKSCSHIPIQLNLFDAR